MALMVSRRPLTARSVVLSLLLGTPDGSLPVRRLVALAERFGVSPGTVRVALSRLVAAGDLAVDDATYRLSARHADRLTAQAADLDPQVHDHGGAWELLVVDVTARDAATRSTMRRAFVAAHLAELRDGVWTRPANLARTVPASGAVVFTARPDDEAELVARLWPLDAWQAEATALVEALTSSRDLADRFVVAAAAVRHLRTDPQLPSALRPPGWGGDDLRAAYARFRSELEQITQEDPS